MCDELYLVHDGQCDIFDKDITDYSQWLNEIRKQQQKQLTAEKKQANKNKVSHETATILSKEEQRKKSAEQRKLTAPLRKKIVDNEQLLEKLTQKISNIEEKLADTSLYEDNRKNELLTLLNEQTALKQHIEQVEENLIAMMMALEELEQSFE